jgi:hypothetical protein
VDSSVGAAVSTAASLAGGAAASVVADPLSLPPQAASVSALTAAKAINRSRRKIIRFSP